MNNEIWIQLAIYMPAPWIQIKSVKTRRACTYKSQINQTLCMKVHANIDFAWREYAYLNKIDPAR